MNNIALYTEKIEKALKDRIPGLPKELEQIAEMLDYSLSGGGKRIRPLMCLEFCAAAGGNVDTALLFACAVEFVHTYSLIHDDLPCMDNDDYRRGKLSSHKKFGEANALLAGDALLTHAFYIIADACEKGDVTPIQAVTAVKELSHLCGMSGMVGGQFIDLKYENSAAEACVLSQMDLLKTSALIESACVLGLTAANADKKYIDAARVFAHELGLAFQITDDVLEALEEGKSSDEKNGKATYVSLFGLDLARKKACEHTENALNALDVFGESADEIKMIAKELLHRKN